MGVYEQLFDDEENMKMNCAAFERKGFKAGSRAVARRMLSKGMSPEEVSDLTERRRRREGFFLSLRGRFPLRHDRREIYTATRIRASCQAPSRDGRFRSRNACPVR